MLKIVFPLALLLMFSNCANNEKSNDYTKIESFLHGYFSSENLKNISSIFVVGDNGCQLCYMNLENALIENERSFLLYYSSNSKISYQKTIFKKYLPENRLKITYQPDLLNHFSEQHGFIKSFVELKLVEGEIQNLVLYD